MGRSNSCIAVVVIKLLNNLCEYPSNICIRCIRIDFPPSEQIKSANADADLEELRTDTDQILADTGRILHMASSARIWIICLSHWHRRARSSPCMRDGRRSSAVCRSAVQEPTIHTAEVGPRTQATRSAIATTVTNAATARVDTSG